MPEPPPPDSSRRRRRWRQSWRPSTAEDCPGGLDATDRRRPATRPRCLQTSDSNERTDGSRRLRRQTASGDGCRGSTVRRRWRRLTLPDGRGRCRGRLPRRRHGSTAPTPTATTRGRDDAQGGINTKNAAETNSDGRDMSGRLCRPRSRPIFPTTPRWLQLDAASDDAHARTGDQGAETFTDDPKDVDRRRRCEAGVQISERKTQRNRPTTRS